MTPLPLSHSRGAALAVSLFLLVVITLLGLAAMRASQLSLKLAVNEESRVDAMESAQSLSAALLSDVDSSFPVAPEAGYQVSCYPAGLTANTEPFYAPFGCAAAGITPPATSDDKFGEHSYIEVYRESVNGAPLLNTNSAPTGGTSYRVQFARFRITAGYDRSEEGMGVAEVIQGVNVAVPQTPGMNIF